MKIICKNTREFYKLMRACEYLHNLNNIDCDKHKILNDFRHLYLDEADFPDKKKFVSINGRKDLPKRDKTRWGTRK